MNIIFQCLQGFQITIKLRKMNELECFQISSKSYLWNKSSVVHEIIRKSSFPSWKRHSNYCLSNERSTESTRRNFTYREKRKFLWFCELSLNTSTRVDSLAAAGCAVSSCILVRCEKCRESKYSRVFREDCLEYERRLIHPSRLPRATAGEY